MRICILRSLTCGLDHHFVRGADRYRSAILHFEPRPDATGQIDRVLQIVAVADRANGEWGFQFGAVADETAGRATDVSAGYHADIVDLNDLGTTVAQFLKQREQYRGVNLLFGTLRYADDHAFSRSRETAR